MAPKLEEKKSDAKPMESAATRVEKGKGGKDGKLATSQELRPKEEQPEPGRVETIGPLVPKNNIEALKAQGKQFGGAEGELQKKEALAKEEASKVPNQSEIK